MLRSGDPVCGILRLASGGQEEIRLQGRFALQLALSGNCDVDMVYLGPPDASDGDSTEALLAFWLALTSTMAKLPDIAPEIREMCTEFCQQVGVGDKSTTPKAEA